MKKTLVKEISPVIFWHSDPVGPDETVVLSGAGFSSKSVVEFAVQSDDDVKFGDWTPVKPLQSSDISLKAVIPAAWPQGIYKCRVRKEDAVSKEVLINTPDVWWFQGDEGVNRARVGAWLRVMGKCLDFGKQAQIILSDSKGEHSLELIDRSCYNLEAAIPSELAPGIYQVEVSNGHSRVCCGELEILPTAQPDKRQLSILKYGADPTGMEDSTLAIVQATERLSSLGGGTVYFPRGRYRIDSVLRSGTFIDSPLWIPENVKFIGDGPDLTCLWWPDRDEPLPALLEGNNDFSIENLAIYTQGCHSTIIHGKSGVRLRNLLIRANCYYMTNDNGQRAHHKRKLEGPGASGAAIFLWGDNNQVTDCDIYTSVMAFDLRQGRGSRIANNTAFAKNMHSMSGCREMIFENNSYTGNQLTAGGNNIALHMGASICKHIYYAGNKFNHIYGGDHEAFTLDGHGTAYLGKVKSLDGKHFKLTGKVFPHDKKAKGAMHDMHDTAVYIIEGTGAGQYRFLSSYNGNEIELEKPWDLEPDESSLVCIGGFNGRHLFIGNTATDTGTLIQLYPPNCECIVAENRSVRASNINSLGKLGKHKEVNFVRCEISWYNQFLDNHIIIGNTWGGGQTEIDRWIGGECTLNIWGWEIYYYSINGEDFDEFMRPDVLRMITGEDKERSETIPISRFQIVRRHKVDNNSSIRIRGAVSDVLIENCDLQKSRKGIRVDKEMFYKQPEDLGQLFNFDPEPDADNQPLDFLSPHNVVIRNNQYEEVEIPLSGTALNSTDIVTIEQN